MRRALGLVLLLVATLASQAWSDPPKPIDTPAPQYPKWAIGSGLATEVELRARVGREGRVHEVVVVPYDVRRDIQTREMRASFDSAAVRAVRSWTFTPARHAGRAVAVWWTLRVPFADPANASGPGAGPSAVSSATFADTTEIRPFMEPIERQNPEWPAAVPYVCRGRVTVRIFPGRDGRVSSANVVKVDLSCQDPSLRAAIDAAVVRAALRWRYPADDHEVEPIQVVFTIPPPRLDVPVIVGCVRDSLSGRLRPEAEIFERDDRHAFGQADDTGWFVLRGAVTRLPRVRARLSCRTGGFRTVRRWKQPGDELTLYTGRGPCAEGTR